MSSLSECIGRNIVAITKWSRLHLRFMLHETVFILPLSSISKFCFRVHTLAVNYYSVRGSNDPQARRGLAMFSISERTTVDRSSSKRSLRWKGAERAKIRSSRIGYTARCWTITRSRRPRNATTGGGLVALVFGVWRRNKARQKGSETSMVPRGLARSVGRGVKRGTGKDRTIPQSFGPLPATRLAFYARSRRIPTHRQNSRTHPRIGGEERGWHWRIPDETAPLANALRILTLAKRRGPARTADISTWLNARPRSFAAGRGRNLTVFGTIGFCLVSNEELQSARRGGNSTWTSSSYPTIVRVRITRIISLFRVRVRRKLQLAAGVSKLERLELRCG